MKQYFLLGIVLLHIIGCSNIYRPATPEATVFKGKSELHTEFGITGYGINLKPSYSLTNHLSISSLVNYRVGAKKYFEGSMGAFSNLNSNTYSQILFGIGKGNSSFSDINSEDSTIITDATGHYQKYYGQINLISIKKQQTTIGACLRFAKIQFTYTEINHSPTDQTIDINYFEPFVFLRNRLTNNSYINAYFGMAFKSVPETVMRTYPVNFGIGVAIQFTKRDLSEDGSKKIKKEL